MFAIVVQRCWQVWLVLWLFLPTAPRLTPHPITNNKQTNVMRAYSSKTAVQTDSGEECRHASQPSFEAAMFFLIQFVIHLILSSAEPIWLWVLSELKKSMGYFRSNRTQYSAGDIIGEVGFWINWFVSGFWINKTTLYNIIWEMNLTPIYSPSCELNLSDNSCHFSEVPVSHHYYLHIPTVPQA